MSNLHSHVVVTSYNNILLVLILPRFRALESTAGTRDLGLRRADVDGLRADSGGDAAINAVECARSATQGHDMRDAQRVG